MESHEHSNPLLSFSNFISQHRVHLGANLSTCLDDTRRTLAQAHHNPLSPKHALIATATLGFNHITKSLIGASVYTISNSNNESTLISDANGDTWPTNWRCGDVSRSCYVKRRKRREPLQWPVRGGKRSLPAFDFGGGDGGMRPWQRRASMVFLLEGDSRSLGC